MGYSTRNGNIRTFTPDNDENTLYVESNIGLIDLLDKIRQHFPNTAYADLNISSEYIHTDCIGYDQYDPSDYTNYIVITR